jgi:predicted lipoprotein with Yx(FWY)xxD motif
MLHRTSVTIAGSGVAAALAIGALAATGSQGPNRASTSTASSNVIGSAIAAVGGKAQTILTDSRGMPLYYYAADGPKQSLVSGNLARLWPPATSTGTPAALGLGGSLTVVRDSHGSQVAYNGHLLYTFVSDQRGVVTGQGVENFFVATPTLSKVAGSSSSGADSGTTTYGGY